MKLIRTFLSIGSLVILGISSLPAQQGRTAPLAASESIANLGPLLQRVNALKSEFRQYHACSCTCGCYEKDLDAEADRAIAFLRTRVAHRKSNERLAMVLDIDETTLSNWAEMDAANFEYNGKEFDAWIESAQAPAIAGTLRLYRQARELRVAVFFLTGRPESQRAATEANLRLRGFDDWQQIIMRSSGEKGETALVFKSGERRKIRAAGFRIVLNVGDQWSDLRSDLRSDLGGAAQAEYSVKYPDPFYFIK